MLCNVFSALASESSFGLAPFDLLILLCFNHVLTFLVLKVLWAYFIYFPPQP